MNFNSARLQAVKYLESQSPPAGDRYLIIDSAVLETEEGWYFPYQTERFLNTKDLKYSVVGNWPIFVSRLYELVEPRRPPAPAGSNNSFKADGVPPRP